MLLLRVPEVTHELMLFPAHLEIVRSVHVLRLDSRIAIAAYSAIWTVTLNVFVVLLLWGPEMAAGLVSS